MTATGQADLGRMRGLLFRLSAMQGALVVALLLVALLFGDARTIPLLLWLVLIPVIVMGVAVAYYARVRRLAEGGGYSRSADTRLTREAYRHLGAGLVLWIAGLLALLYF